MADILTANAELALLRCLDDHQKAKENLASCKNSKDTWVASCRTWMGAPPTKKSLKMREHCTRNCRMAMEEYMAAEKKADIVRTVLERQILQLPKEMQAKFSV